VYPSGVEAEARSYAVQISASANVELTGVECMGLVSEVLVWNNIGPDQDPNWTPIAPSTGGGYSPINPSQSANWVPIAA
jgi:hypothetical protein